MPGDHKALARQWLLIQRLSFSKHGLSIKDMERELTVNEKTIRRDLALFKSLGMPLVEEVGDYGRKTWRMRSSAQLPSLDFSFDEVASLCLAERFLEPLAGTEIFTAASHAFRKIRTLVQPRALDYFAQFGRSIHQTRQGRHDYSERREVLDELNRAIVERLITQISYQSVRATEPAFREVHPYLLTWHKNALYLHAFDSEERRYKLYKVDRIDAIDVSALQFQHREDFAAESVLADSFGVYSGAGVQLVRVRFLGDAVRYVSEANWHPSQKLDPQSDGSLIAEFRLSSTVEIKSFVLGFGSKARVLEPESLSHEIAAELAESAAAYRTPEPASIRTKKGSRR